MTERLTTLFHQEASAIEVPRPPADAVLSRGHDLRRRRRTVTAVIGAVVAVVLVGTTLAVVATLRGDSQVQPADLPDDAAYRQLGAWARGDEVHVGNATAVVPAVTGLHYTSLGALALSRAEGTATLVGPDGTAHELDYDGMADGAVTDPATPYVAYAHAVTGDTWKPVVVDLESGDELYVGAPVRDRSLVANVTGLAGDVLTYIGPDGLASVDWRTGAGVPLPRHGFYSMYTAGAQTYVTGDDDGWLVHDRDDESVLLDVPYGEDGRYDQSSISPDGKWLAISTPGGMSVYEVATGDHVDLGDDRDVTDYGWTPDGHLVGKRYPSATSEVEVCDPATGACTGLGQTVRGQLTLVLGVAGIPVGS